ncbi:Asp/Glu/hydantoin racemase [Armillaria nabsnona]|nr:Asp/Glu/hydantoin racemase [Armillaria nabsnona]
MAPASILVINPNSSQSITDGLKVAPPEARLTFYMAPSHARPFIIEKQLLEKHDGFLVCCFSDHLLAHMLHEVMTKPTIGIFEAAITQALLIGKRFGVVTTGTGYKFNLYNGVRAFMGANSKRFAGLVTTGLGVVELREGDRKKIEKNMKEASGEMASQGADVILLGCAGMAGMESLVKQGAAKANPGLPPVRVLDDAKAGVDGFHLDQVIRVTILIL